MTLTIDPKIITKEFAAFKRYFLADLKAYGLTDYVEWVELTDASHYRARKFVVGGKGGPTLTEAEADELTNHSVDWFKRDDTLTGEKNVDVSWYTDYEPILGLYQAVMDDLDREDGSYVIAKAVCCAVHESMEKAAVKVHDFDYKKASNQEYGFDVLNNTALWPHDRGGKSIPLARVKVTFIDEPFDPNVTF